MKNNLLLVLLFIANFAFAQSFKISGKIFDSKTNKPLQYASIKIENSGSGTTADENGEFILKVNKGSYNLITSYIGYFSDTSSFYVDDSNLNRDIFLKSSELTTDVIEVAGEDPAYEIIRKAIKYKKEFKKELNEYNYDAYSKFVIKSNVNPFNDNTLKKDSSGMTIFGILESESISYFKKPDLEKQIIKSKRETANISRGFALPLIVNFYDDIIYLGQTKVPSPLNDDAFDYYEYKLIGTTSLDSTIVFKIKVINTSSLTPQFLGNIYIIDKLFALIKIDLETNSEVISGVDKLHFLQKFSQYFDKNKNLFFMPSDIQIFADGTFAGLFKFKGDVFTIVSDYRLNQKTPAGIFDDVIIKVEKDAKKDSVYWNKNQLIKNSDEEKSAYKTIEKTTDDRLSGTRFNGISIGIGKYFSADLLDLYKFNSVAGHQLGLTIKYSKDFGRTNSDLYYGYGFSDKKAKYKFNFNSYFLKDNSLRLNFSAFNFLNSPFMNRSTISDLENVAYTLLTKKERYYYYYSNGYSLDIRKNIIPQIGLGIGYFQSKQTSAQVNTDFTFFKRNHPYTNNPQINDAFKRSLSLTLRLDPNSYRAIDWGDGEISRLRMTQYPSITFKLENSSKNLGSTFDNRKYTIEISGQNNFTARIKPVYRLGYKFINGSIPFQDLLYFDVYKNNNDLIFSVMDYGEFYGDKLWYFNLENNFGKLFPPTIKFLKSINFIGFLNIGRSYLSSDILPKYSFDAVKPTNGTFVETGFGISNILNLVRFNLGWRLNNYKQGSNFTYFLNINM